MTHARFVKYVPVNCSQSPGGDANDDDDASVEERPRTGWHAAASLWLAKQTTGRKVPMAGAGAGLLISTAFFLLLYFKKWLPEAYFKFTDSKTTFFDNFQINTEERFAVGAAIVFTNTFVNTLIGTIVGNWISNGVNDFKTSLADATGNDKLKAKLTVQIYVVYSTLSRAVSIYFLFVNFWFIMIQLMASMLAVSFTTSAFLEAKTMKKGAVDGTAGESRDYMKAIHSMESGDCDLLHNARTCGSSAFQIRI